MSFPPFRPAKSFNFWHKHAHTKDKYFSFSLCLAHTRTLCNHSLIFQLHTHTHSKLHWYFCEDLRWHITSPCPINKFLTLKTPFEGLSQTLNRPKHPDFMNLALTKIDVPTHLTFWVWSCREGKGCAVSQIACRLFASSVSPPCLLFYLLLLPYFAELLSETHPPHEPWQSERCPHGLETVQKHSFSLGICDCRTCGIWLSTRR